MATETTARPARCALVYGAGASLAAPADRPLFFALRQALFDQLDVDLGDTELSRRMAPEALLSRLAAAGIDINGELRGMLGGGAPNALHVVAVEVLQRGDAVWTTNFDELVETAAANAGVDIHRLLPGDDPRCRCGRGHLVKPHGTLSTAHVLARSEDVLAPMPAPWLERLAADLDGADVAVVGYAGADVDLRTGLAAALSTTASLTWFGRPDDEASLRERFGPISLALSDRPDCAAFAWARDHGLTAKVTPELADELREPIQYPAVQATFSADRLLRARIIDDFGRAQEARRGYRAAMLRGPRRGAAAAALYSSGMIHGAPWRAPAVAALHLACALPLRWAAPHRQRLPYLTWNVEAEPRLRALERSLRVAGDDLATMLAAANAAKEVDPLRAVELARQAQAAALAAERPGPLAWATFTLSLALRWLGDIDEARVQARQLTDAYGPLASPSWSAWGHFETGAVMALAGDLTQAAEQMLLASEVFTAAGSVFAFDAWCGALAVHRAAGDDQARRHAHSEASRLLNDASLRRRFMREVLLVEDAELARQEGRLDEAETMYKELATSPTLAQHLLGLLGLGEIQRRRREDPAAAREALVVSDRRRFGFGQVHACVTLGLAGAMSLDEAEQRIADSIFDPPVCDGVRGLLRFCQGPDSQQHLLCFP
jgi:tetratricopeptide (TPR) repeat protein